MGSAASFDDGDCRRIRQRDDSRGVGRNRRKVSYLNQMYLWQGQFKQHCCMSISLVAHADNWADRSLDGQVPAMIYLFVTMNVYVSAGRVLSPV
jgi:hypothetical protein